MMKLSLISKGFAALLLLFLLPSPAKAVVVTITQNQPLSFGTFSTGTFSSVVSIRIRDNGTYETTGLVAVLIAPTIGEYTLDAGIGEAGTVYTITTPPNITLTGPETTFLIDDIRITPAILQFEPDGTDDISVAAQISSLGDGDGFNSGSYSGNLNLTIAF